MLHEKIMKRYGIKNGAQQSRILIDNRTHNLA